MFSNLSFVAPTLLIALIALPILWYILRALPQAPKQLRFPGYFFLKQISNREEAASKTPWYIILIRTLLLASLIVGLAGPLTNRPQFSASDKPILIVLDDGWAAANKWPLREQALIQLAEKVEQHNLQAWVMLTSAKQAGREEQTIRGPLIAEDLRQFAKTYTPTSAPLDRTEALNNFNKLYPSLAEQDFDIHWLTDGAFIDDDLRQRQFIAKLDDLGDLTLYQPSTPPVLIKDVSFLSETLEVTITRPFGFDAAYEDTLLVLARDGRTLQRAAIQLEVGEKEKSFSIELPLTIRNDIGQIKLTRERSAGGVYLADASSRRASVGLVSQSSNAAGSLLDSKFYIRQAVETFSQFQMRPIQELIQADTTIIILDDSGRLREPEASNLRKWVEDGGILVRFSGPLLAEAVQQFGQEDLAPLLPVKLRGGGRAFGGALTWETPQKLGAFDDESPFATLTLDEDLTFKRQVLALPNADQAVKNWAYLEDGTPLVTARQTGKGMLILFHVTADPNWSDLPLSGLFVEMFQRLTALSVAENTVIDTTAKYTPLSLLNGYGELRGASADASPITITPDKVHTASQRAGFYGDNATPIAVNVASKDTKLFALDDIGAYDESYVRPYDQLSTKNYTGLFLTLAALLLLIDIIIMQIINKRIPLRALNIAPLIALTAISIISSLHESYAQDRPALDQKAIAAVQKTRFAYVISGNRSIDDIAKAGLEGLTRKVAERSALEPEAPIGLNLEQDDISVYPLIYWPITANTSVPSPDALTKLEAYMETGGLIIFDTRDGPQKLGNRETPESTALKNILLQINIPPLEPFSNGHVLSRSFYLMSDLPGRNTDGPVWVQSRTAGVSLNDSVTPVIIGGRDWASAWALDAQGRPLRPMGAGSIGGREMAFRTGINMVMVALTGNYKVDQLQTETMLEQLGRE